MRKQYAGVASYALRALLACVVIAAAVGFFEGEASAASEVEAAALPTGYERWSDLATWRSMGYQGRPTAGAVVMIPAGKKIVLDQSTPALGGVVVEGELRLAEMRVELKSEYVMVHSGGTFVAGTKDDPIDPFNQATITLTGNDPTKNVMGMGTKFLGAMEGGRIELHSADKMPWTRLSATAAKNSYTIRVDDATGWRVGDNIAIASSDFHWNHTERRTISRITFASGTQQHSALQFR